MSRNPLYNAILALGYICLVASVMFYGMKRVPGPDNSVIIPIAVLSLLTLSTAVMAYLFASQPLQLYLDGKKKEGVRLFIQTLGAFGVITLVVFAVLFSRILA